MSCEQKCNGFSRHHVVPRSRGGLDIPQNILLVPVHIHEAWHTLFSNRTPEQAESYAQVMWLTWDYLSHKQQVCWKLLFNDRNYCDIRIYIRGVWSHGGDYVPIKDFFKEEK